MKILYDYQTFFIQNFGGISKCFAELIHNLPTNVNVTIGIKESDNVYLNELNLVPNLQPLHWTRDNFILPFYFKGQGKILRFCNKFDFIKTPYNINKKYSIELLKKGDFDIFHPTYFDDYFLPYLGSKPFVLTIHDMISELFFPSNNIQSIKKRILAEKASHIIAVSENTKKDIIKLYGISADKISVIYHASELSSSKPSNSSTKEYKLPEKYFLYLGLRNSYKGFQDFLTQTARFFQKHKNVHLICTGTPFSKYEKEFISKLNLSDQIINAFFSTEQLRTVYSNAIAFVYPSRYEGFGIPILEAFEMKCPVILNNASCFPEIAKDAAIYFNLDDKNSCLNALENVYNFTIEEKNQLISKGIERHKDFSWQKSAHQLVEVYHSILK